MKQLPMMCLIVVVAVVTVAAQKQEYGVTVTADRKADFSAYKSYSWDPKSMAVLDKNVHQQVVDAVDREMKSLGFEKRPSAPADVRVAYATQRRVDVDTSSKLPPGQLPEYTVGTLVVVMRESANDKEVFKARVKKPIELTPDKIKTTIDGVVAEMFAKYPTRTRK
jgi:uncharacterized protein DUF4136